MSRLCAQSARRKRRAEMRFYEKDGNKLRQFKTVREVEAQLRLPLAPCWVGASEPPTDEKIKREEKWYGFPSQEAAFQAYFGGWYDESMLGRLKVRKPVTGNEKLRCHTKFDVKGVYPDVSRFMLGLPDNMVEEVFVRKQSKIIKIIYCPNAHCGTDSSEFLKALANIVKLVQTLEMNGYRVDLRVYHYFYDAHSTRKTISFLLPVKDPDRALNLKRCMFAMGHTASFRILAFLLCSKDPETWYISAYGTEEWEKGKENLNRFIDTKGTVVINLRDAVREDRIDDILCEYNVKE